ncbi:MAG: DUF177 domain-containing protein [Proteobacteria bacterium]|jgi:uncharacterized protein|nr:DUF177 domain-containing protein [Pseudomonadota bacterium]
MKLRIKDITPEGTELEFEHGEDFLEKFSPQPGGFWFRLAEPVHGSLSTTRTGLDITISGRIAGRVFLTCRRCLEEFPSEFSRDFYLDLLPEIEIRDRSGDIQLKKEELEQGYYQDDYLDLDQILLEQIVLSITENPLCREDCPGLCPICGANRNLRECQCSQAGLSAHPFAVLKKYKV